MTNITITNLLRLWIFVSFIFIPLPLQAETEPVSPSPNQLDELDIFQVVTPLLMVIVLIFILAWLVKKINRGIPITGKDIEIISTTPLSSQSRLCLIRVADKDMLIGVTATNITLLQSFDEPVLQSHPRENSVEFAEHFRKLLNRKSS